MTEPTLCVDRLTPAIGARITGVNLRGACRRDAARSPLCVTPRWCCSCPTRHACHVARVCRNLWRPRHPAPCLPPRARLRAHCVAENDGDCPPNTDVWHTDLTFKQQPPFAAILYANAIPASGGDTLWCSMYAAYDALTDGMKAISATSVPCMPPARTGINFLPKAGSRVSMKAWRPWERRCIRSSPATRSPASRVSLRQSAFHDARLRAVQRRQSAPADGVVRPHQPARLSGPLALAARDGGAVGHRITQHYAAADYLPQYRCMHRVTVVNDRRSPKP